MEEGPSWDSGATRRVASREVLLRLLDALTIVVLLGLAWFFSYSTGGSRTAAPHAFYVPVVVAAVRFGWWGTGFTASTAGVLAGPLLPLDVAQGAAQTMPNWLIRAGFFLAIGLLTASLVHHVRRSAARELSIRDRERDLEIQKGTLIQSVSHEFRTPLTVIRGTVDTLETHELVVGRGRALMPGMRRASERLDFLVRSVLAVAGLADGDRRLPTARLSPEEVIDDTVSTLESHRASERVRLMNEGVDEIVTNRELLVVMLRALIENALKFSPCGEAVEIFVGQRRECVRIAVRDYGPGVDPKYIRHAPTPFEQGDTSTTRAHGGLGLGLFVANRIARFLGGELRLDRPEGGGTRAVVLLPQRRSLDRDAGETARSSSPYARRDSNPEPAD